MGQLSVHPIIYQLRIILRGISPLIWHRLLVRSETTLAQLHAILQILFAWSDEHLYSFHAHGREYGSNGARPTYIRLREFQAEHILPVKATPHGVSGLAIREPCGAWQARDERSPPGGLSRLPVCGEACQTSRIREQPLQCIGHAQGPVALGTGGAGDAGRFWWDGCAWHRATPGTPPRL
jgi:hypothetical protein